MDISLPCRDLSSGGVIMEVTLDGSHPTTNWPYHVNKYCCRYCQDRLLAYQCNSNTRPSLHSQIPEVLRMQNIKLKEIGKQRIDKKGSSTKSIKYYSRWSREINKESHWWRQTKKPADMQLCQWDSLLIHFLVVAKSNRRVSPAAEKSEKKITKQISP